MGEFFVVGVRNGAGEYTPHGPGSIPAGSAGLESSQMWAQCSLLFIRNRSIIQQELNLALD